MKKVICILIICSCVLACQKKVISEGTVYSKYKHPMANIKVVIAEYTTGKDAALTLTSTTTDNNGKFMFKYLTSKNRYFSIDVACDSGWAHKQPLDRDQLKYINLRLNR